MHKHKYEMIKCEECIYIDKCIKLVVNWQPFYLDECNAPESKPLRGKMKMIYDYVNEHEGCTCNEICDALGTLKTTTHKALQRLRDYGLVVSKVERGVAYWM